MVGRASDSEQPFPHTCACTKGSVNQHTENAVCSSLLLKVIFRAEMLQMRLALFFTVTEMVWPHLDNLSALGKALMVSLVNSL